MAAKWLFCVVSCQGVYQGLMTALLPKGVIQVDLGIPSSCLKGARMDHFSALYFCILLSTNSMNLLPSKGLVKGPFSQEYLMAQEPL